MKVYVENDDIPKRCAECRFCYYSEDEYHHCCRISGVDIENKKCWRETHPDCPLQSLADYTKQVRKEVCEEIKDLAGNYFELPYCDNCGETSNDDVVLTGNDLTDILDQIQGETK